MSMEQQLINLGYKKYTSHINQILHNTSIMYDKTIYDSFGAKYDIVITFYAEIEVPYCDERIKITCQFYDIHGQPFMDVVLFENDIGIAEQKLDDVWNKNGLGYYEKSQKYPTEWFTQIAEYSFCRSMSEGSYYCPNCGTWSGSCMSPQDVPLKIYAMCCDCFEDEY